jgi:hypothetical protein
MGNDQEIEFQETEIGVFQEIESFFLQNCSGDRNGPRGPRGLG